MKLYIKNMVCARCTIVVRSELEKLGLNYITMKTGEVEVQDDIPEEKQLQVRLAMNQLGLELIDDHDSIIIERIKTTIIHLISEEEEQLRTKISDYVSSKLGYSYHYLSSLFSAIHGSSIERYYITHKIERVKEMLIHERLSFSEIAFRMRYSSVAHLSGQFKKETGLTLTQFRQLGHMEILKPPDG
jgi:AraC-like DNA-binding protein